MPGTNVKLQKMGYLYNILPVVQKMLKRGNSKHKKTILEREAYFPCQKQLCKNCMSLIHSNNATVVPIAEYSMVLLIHTPASIVLLNKQQRPCASKDNQFCEILTTQAYKSCTRQCVMPMHITVGARTLVLTHYAT